VAARAVGDEVEVVALHRIEHGLQGRLARIGDRRRRQAVDQIGVVGRLALQFRLADATAQRPSAGQAVDDGRVAAQADALRRRLMNTAATCGRSRARPVSFSTIEAMVTAWSLVSNGRPGWRLAHSCRAACRGRPSSAAARRRGPRRAGPVGLGQDRAFGGVGRCRSVHGDLHQDVDHHVRGQALGDGHQWRTILPSRILASTWPARRARRTRIRRPSACAPRRWSGRRSGRSRTSGSPRLLQAGGDLGQAGAAPQDDGGLDVARTAAGPGPW
jgi:hypothetical protein